MTSHHLDRLSRPLQPRLGSLSLWVTKTSKLYIITLFIPEICVHLSEIILYVLSCLRCVSGPLMCQYPSFMSMTVKIDFPGNCYCISVGVRTHVKNFN